MRSQFSYRFVALAVITVSLAHLAACARHKPSADHFDSLDRFLSGREGTIILSDPSTGRIRAISNRRLAFEQAFPPGSAIKPFVLLAALRAGIVNSDTHRQCSGEYSSPQYHVVCSHAKSLRPFGPVEALAYSCNDYFAHVGERLNEGAFLSTLTAFGFGRRTGVNGPNESGGVLRAGDWGPRKAIGESDTVLVTPIQLLVAYSALFNGGKVLRPDLESGDLSPRAKLEIPERDLDLVMQGMRGSVRFGTSRGAGFDANRELVYGKTGTSTSSNGWTTQGWFVGFAGKSRKPELGIVVLLKRGSGREAARVAANVLNAAPEEMPDTFAGRQIKVKTTGDHRILQLPLERYIAGVLVAEYSVEESSQAVKAHAVASRSYALANLGRHGNEGFDFCSTTHCQRFEMALPTLEQRRAVNETSQLVLVDQSGDPIEAFFHADCGGSTTSATALWGRGGHPYLREVEDKYCERQGKEWTDRISSKQLAEAFMRDPRSNTGDALGNIRVTARDTSGRAEWISLEGQNSKRIRGWEFKMIVGRSLGWNVIKSSHFDVWRDGEDFVFHGRGHGHGLGMCQAGAGAMAARGADYTEILAHYFPGTSISRSSESSAQRSLASEHFRIYFTSLTTEAEVHKALEALEAGYADLEKRLEAASVPFPLNGRIEVTISASTANYIAATGMPGWTAAITRNGKIISQPLSLLNERRVFSTALRHEFAHVAIGSLTADAPRWLAEGLAVHFAGEGPLLAGERSSRLALDELERRIAVPRSAAEMKNLYAQAYREVLSRIRADGEPGLWRQLARKPKKESVQSLPPD